LKKTVLKLAFAVSDPVDVPLCDAKSSEICIELVLLWAKGDAALTLMSQGEPLGEPPPGAQIGQRGTG